WPPRTGRGRATRCPASAGRLRGGLVEPSPGVWKRGGSGVARDGERSALHRAPAHGPLTDALRVTRTPVLRGLVDGAAHAALRGAPGGALAPGAPGALAAAGHHPAGDVSRAGGSLDGAAAGGGSLRVTWGDRRGAEPLASLDAALRVPAR